MTIKRCVLAALVSGLLLACNGDDAIPESRGADSGPPIPVAMSGMYSYMADAALFTDCEAGLSYPVAAEGDAAVLERAYLGLQTGAGEPLLVSLQGYVAPRPGAEGGTVDALVVTSFETVFMGQACVGEVTGQALEGPEWTALSVLGTTPSAEDPPTLSLDSEEGLVAWSGCANVSGSYSLRGAELRFSGITLPERQCTGLLGRIEQALMQALQATRSYEIRGDTLKLIGETGVVARFAWH